MLCKDGINEEEAGMPRKRPSSPLTIRRVSFRGRSASPKQAPSGWLLAQFRRKDPSPIPPYLTSDPSPFNQPTTPIHHSHPLAIVENAIAAPRETPPPKDHDPEAAGPITTATIHAQLNITLPPLRTTTTP
jgi:hypothetical protein